MNEKTCQRLSKTIGSIYAHILYYRFIQDFATRVARLDRENFVEILDETRINTISDYKKAIKHSLAFYKAESGIDFPQDANDQLSQVINSLLHSWNGATARILREVHGAPIDAVLGFIVQEMVLGIGEGNYGSGLAQFVSPTSGNELPFGRYLPQSQGRAALEKDTDAEFLSIDKRGPSLEKTNSKALDALKSIAVTLRQLYRDEMQFDFTVESGNVSILGVKPAERNNRAAVSIAVQLKKLGLISKEDALMRINPNRLNEILHPMIDPKAIRKEIARGISASPGAASGKIVFSASSAMVAESRGEAAILIMIETSPDDIRGMHSANGVLTIRGGINSHAAVVARALGLPCIVGAHELNLNIDKKILILQDGTKLSEGDTITLDGTTGQILWGQVKLIKQEHGSDFENFIGWADQVSKLDVRGNADTPEDVRMARDFGVAGIGLVRTEHMFYDTERLTVMRELIFNEKENEHNAALDILLPMQRNDFIAIFDLMKEQPVCIRLLDPPLHEFLPKTAVQIKTLADAMNLPVSRIVERIKILEEINPMLGMRGVRLGIMIPGIYDMQVQAIFEAACKVERDTNTKVSPEIMIPFVSAKREVELIKSRIRAIATTVQNNLGQPVHYSIGIMIETPRVALRANDIAQTVDFISFGTNDLTQMTYGLSRDDVGRFMPEYLRQKVYSDDPFITLDLDGVGELISLAIERARDANPNISIGLCGEHGADPKSVWFCHEVGVDYVSCSSFRAPVAKLAAAQAAIRASIT